MYSFWVYIPLSNALFQLNEFDFEVVTIAQGMSNK